MNKNRQILSELKDFFKHNDSSKAVNAVNRVMDRLVIQAKTVGPVKNPNCKFTFVQLVKLLVVQPFFSVKTPAEYADSALGKFFAKLYYQQALCFSDNHPLRRLLSILCQVRW